MSGADRRRDLCALRRTRNVRRWLVDAEQRKKCSNDRSHKPMGDDQRIVIPVTQEMLASLAGTTRPTANQVLRRLVASEIVEVSRSQIVVLNRTALHQRAGYAGQT